MPAYPKPKVKEFVRPIPHDWWLKKPAYTRFMIRELSSGVLALYALFLLWFMRHALHHPGDVDRLVELLKSPVSILLHAVILGFALVNTLTTFNLAPRVLKLQVGDQKVPETAISGAHYAVWVIVSLILFYIALRG